MKKYRKFKKRRMFNPYIIFLVAIIGVLTMSVGYAVTTQTMTITGTANAKYKEYQINYVLNRGTNPANAVTSYTVLDDIPLPIPTREGFLFLGWYADDGFDGSQLTTTSELNGDVTLYAKWKSANYYFQEYRHDEPFIFDGSSYLDSGIALYSEENWQKDYEIGFTIESYSPSLNVNQAVFVNTKYEKESAKYPGLVFRREAGSIDTEITQTINNGSKASYKITNHTYPMTVKIFRIDGEIYFSINNGALMFLQDMSNFNNPFNRTVWFGAAEDEFGSPMRILVGTLSNMYVKLEEFETRKFTVTFNANGGTVAEQSRRVKEYTAVGELPIPTYERRNFVGWYTDSALTHRADASLIINEDTTLYAKWSDQLNVLYNGVYYETITEAIQQVPESDEYSTITISNNMSNNITIPAGKSIILDLENSVLSNDGVSPVISNHGNLKIVNGIITSNTTQGTVNNESDGYLEISGGEIYNTGTKQAVWNNGGEVLITGNPTLVSYSSNRAAVHNLNNGKMTITGGTIVSYNQVGLNNEKGTLTIGVKDGTIDDASPIIQGKTYGITASQTFKFYDGTIIGRTNPVNDVNKISEIEDASEKYNTTQVTDGVTYKLLYLIPSNE